VGCTEGPRPEAVAIRSRRHGRMADPDGLAGPGTPGSAHCRAHVHPGRARPRAATLGRRPRPSRDTGDRTDVPVHLCPHDDPDKTAQFRVLLAIRLRALLIRRLNVQVLLGPLKSMGIWERAGGSETPGTTARGNGRERIRRRQTLLCPLPSPANLQRIASVGVSVLPSGCRDSASQRGTGRNAVERRGLTIPECPRDDPGQDRVLVGIWLTVASAFDSRRLHL
jgi:hypothetical protein